MIEYTGSFKELVKKFLDTGITSELLGVEVDEDELETLLATMPDTVISFCVTIKPDSLQYYTEIPEYELICGSKISRRGMTRMVQSYVSTLRNNLEPILPLDDLDRFDAVAARCCDVDFLIELLETMFAPAKALSA